VELLSKTPLYVIENNYDTNQLMNHGFPQDGQSEQAQGYVRYYGQAMQNPTAQVKQRPGDGLFLSSCFDHTGGLVDGPSFHTTINIKSDGKLLGDWFYDGSQMWTASSWMTAGTCLANPPALIIPSARPQVTPPTPPGPAPVGCTPTLKEDYSSQTYPTLAKHESCAKAHEAAPARAGCTENTVKRYCKSV
jgi:hypothetical protein